MEAEPPSPRTVLVKRHATQKPRGTPHRSGQHQSLRHVLVETLSPPVCLTSHTARGTGRRPAWADNSLQLLVNRINTVANQIPDGWRGVA